MCGKGYIYILKTRAKEYEKDLNQVMPTPTSKSKKKFQRIVFLKCSDHVDTTSNQWLDENAQYSSSIKFGLLQTIKAGNCDISSLLMTRRAQSTGKEVNSFYERAIVVSLHGIYFNIYPSSIRMVEREMEGLFKTYREINKFTRKSGTYLQKSSEFLSIQRNLFDIIDKF